MLIKVHHDFSLNNSLAVVDNMTRLKDGTILRVTEVSHMPLTATEEDKYVYSLIFKLRYQAIESCLFHFKFYILLLN